MFIRIISFLQLCLFASVIQAQVPDSLWSRTFGGGTDDECHSVQQTTDGGYILAGVTHSFGVGSGDFWLVKTDANGDGLWSRTFGGGALDWCYSVQQTADGGYILAGRTLSFGAGSYDFWLVKTDSNGDSLWSRTFGGGSNEWCYSVQQTSDGGYVLAGYTNSFGAGVQDFWLVKTDATGDSLWTRTFGGGGNEICYSVEQTIDGGYILAGHTSSFGAGDSDFWLVKTDANGDSLWTRTFGGALADECYSVQQTSDGGYVLAGGTRSFGINDDFWMVKTDADGDSLWSRNYGLILNETCRSVRQTSDGGYLLAGDTQSFGAGLNDFWLLRTDANGDTLWGRTFGGETHDYCRSLQLTSGTGYILAGFTLSFGAGAYDFWLVRAAEYGIRSVTDVGNDQGRQVRIRWFRSDQDDVGATSPVLSYAIYRRIDQYLFDDPDREPRTTLDWPPGEWEFMISVPAFTESEYAVVVPTLADSTSLETYYSTFFVRAATASPGIFFDSPIDSGYSIDNLAPEPTLLTAGLQIIGSNIVLRWDEVTTGGGGQPEQNGIWYRVHGDTLSDFIPDAGNLLTTTQQLDYAHPIADEQFFFKVLVSDDH